MDSKKRIHTLQYSDEIGFEVVKINRSSINSQLETHTHDFYTVIFIEKGYGEHYIDCERYNIVDNSMLFITPGQCHAYSSNQIGGYEIIFNGEFMNSNDKNKNIYEYPLFHTSMVLPFLQLPKENHSIKELFERIYTAANSTGFGQRDLLRSYVEILLIEGSRALSLNDNNLTYNSINVDARRVRELECLIDSHYMESRSVQFYAEKLNISPRHLNTITKQRMGISISEMVTRRVLAQAKRMLLYSDDTVTQIAWALNFSDKSYFHRLFKSKVNLTPEEFRSKFLKVHH